MTAPFLKNRVGTAVSGTPGTGVVTLGAALTSASSINPAGWRTPATAGVANGDTVRCLFLDANAWEVSNCVYSSTGPTLTRTLIESSTGSLLSLTSAAQVFIAAVAQDIVPYDSVAGTVAFSNYTVTANSPLLDLSQTWNSGAVNFIGLKLNVTNTASAASSALFDFQIGGASRVRFLPADFSGQSTFVVSGADTDRTNMRIANSTGHTFSFFSTGSGNLNPNTFGVFDDSTSITMISLAGDGTGLSLPVNAMIAWSSISFPPANLDLKLYRDVAGILAQRNSTNAQSLRVYNTFTDASNYERGVFDWTTTANTLTIGTQAAGTGTLRPVNVKWGSSDPGTVLVLDSTGMSLKFGTPGDGQFGFVNISTGQYEFLCSSNGKVFDFGADWAIAFSANARGAGQAWSNIDAGISRSAVGVIAIGNGVQGNTSGTIVATSLGLGVTTTSRRLHVAQDSAATNTVTYLERLTSTSTGTPAVGIGVGIEFEVETAAANNEIGATIEAVATDVTSASEDFDLVFKTMAVGAAAAERFRVASTRVTTSVAFVELPVALTDGATPALDASLGNFFTLSAAGDRTIAVPSNAQAGQKIVIRHLASGAARTLALNAGAGGFRFGSDITALTQTVSGKYDYIGAIYNSTANFWDVVSYVKGF